MENDFRKWVRLIESSDLQKRYDHTLYMYSDAKAELMDAGGKDPLLLSVVRKAREEMIQAKEELDRSLQMTADKQSSLAVDDDGTKSIYHSYKPRGGFTPEKIKKHLRTVSSLSSAATLSNLYNEKGASTFAKEIRKFSSPQEFADHLFFHGTGGYISGGLKPGSVLPKGTTFGGGYDEPYSVISLSKSKNIASNFTGQSRSGSVHPVILRKGAKVISMPQFSDSQELEELLPELWTRGIDAVKIGDWSSPHSEQEICIVNPRAVVIGRSEGFSVFNKTKFENPSDEEIAELYRQACNPPPKA